MKKISYTILMSVVSTVVMAFTSFQRFEREQAIEIEPSRPMALIKITPEAEVPNIIIKDHKAFLNAIGMRESSNRYHIVNKHGYMGKYQFGSKTLRSLGIKVSKKEFLSNPQMQEQAMHLLMRSNYKNLKKYIDKYDGKKIHGVKVTKSGIIAAAHLGGSGNVKKWFRRGLDFSDANGTKITSYMKKFEDYKLNL